MKKLEALSTGSHNRTEAKVKKEEVSDHKIPVLKSNDSKELIKNDLENQNKAAELESPSSEEWEVDDTKYTKGWMYYRYSKKNQHSKIYYHQRFMAPNKQKFPVIRAALAHMIKTNYPEEEIMMMRRAMAESGWRSSENLPRYWFYKRDNKSIDYVDAKGNIFATKNKAIASAVEENMHEEDIEKLKKFQPSKEDNINAHKEGEADTDQDDSMDNSFVGEQNTLDENVYNHENFDNDVQLSKEDEKMNSSDQKGS